MSPFGRQVAINPVFRKLPKLQYVTSQRTTRTCTTCRGEKIIMVRHSEVINNLVTYDNCPACKGTGIIDWSHIQ